MTDANTETSGTSTTPSEGGSAGAADTGGTQTQTQTNATATDAGGDKGNQDTGALGSIGDPATQQQTEAGDTSTDGGEGGEGEYQITLPEGAQIDQEAISAFAELAKAEGIPAEAASKIAAFQVELQQKAEHAYQEAVAAQDKEWSDTIAKKYGDGFEAAKTAAVRFLRAHGGDATSDTGNALTDAINKMGLQNHPQLFDAFVAAGKMMAEDSSDGGKAPGGKPSKLEQIKQAFPNSPELWKQAG